MMPNQVIPNDIPIKDFQVFINLNLRFLNMGDWAGEVLGYFLISH